MNKKGAKAPFLLAVFRQTAGYLLNLINTFAIAIRNKIAASHKSII